jgi:hypothetical protein
MRHVDHCHVARTWAWRTQWMIGAMVNGWKELDIEDPE